MRPMRKILHRYILKEIIGLFSLILGIFLFVLLMGRILRVVDLIVRHGVNPLEILKMFGYLIIYVSPFAIPMATLIALLLCFSRLSGDLEITAMKSSGIGLYQLLPPVMLVSAFMCLATLLVTIHAAPWGSFSFRQLVFETAKRHISVAFKEGVLREIFPDFIVYADRVNAHEGIMEGVFIHDRVSTDVPLEITAQRGVMLRNSQNDEFFSLRLENGTIHQCSLDEGKVRRIHFQAYEINFDRTLSQLSEQLQRTRRKEMGTQALLERINQLRSKNRPVEEYVVEFHWRLTVPISCLVFGLLALPLALQAGPQGRSHGLVMGSLILLVYYLLFSMGKTFSEGGLTPWIGLWGPNLLFGLYAVSLLVRTARERPSILLVRTNQLLDSLLKRVEMLLGKRA